MGGKRFQRQFLIFSNEDPGFEVTRKPSGYVAIEVRDGKGKLISTVQNLRQGNGKYEYVLYLIGNISGKTVPVRVGQFTTGANKTHLEWRFDPGNVGLSGYKIDEFEIVAVLVEYADGRKGSIICPLAAYKNKKKEWRKGFHDAILAESKVKQYKPEYEEDIQAEQYKTEYEEKIGQVQYEPDYGKEMESEPGYENELGKINIDCVYLNGNMCGAFVNKNVSGANLCEECNIRQTQGKALASTTLRIHRLKEELNRYFQKCDPFRSRRSDYTWWNINNPVNLNNILYGSGIRSPLLFNPAVMLAHYKYKHLIIGVFQHKETEKQYVVCGVPCMYMVDQKPFGEMSRWAQAEGSRIRYGAFGYWLVYIDPENGKMLSLN